MELVKFVFIEDQPIKSLHLLYIQMVLPEIHLTINDCSAVVLRGKIFKSWNFDLSNNFGKNSFDIH
jgi:hypothetical protein